MLGYIIILYLKNCCNCLRNITILKLNLKFCTYTTLFLLHIIYEILHLLLNSIIVFPLFILKHLRFLSTFSKSKSKIICSFEGVKSSFFSIQILLLPRSIKLGYTNVKIKLKIVE